MAKSYFEKLKDPRWQRKRLEILERDEFMCVWCGDGEATLHVHHGCYVKGCEPWDYPNEVLHTLCEPCHGIAERDRQTVFQDFGFLSGDFASECLAIFSESMDLSLPLMSAVKLLIQRVKSDLDFRETIEKWGNAEAHIKYRLRKASEAETE